MEGYPKPITCGRNSLHYLQNSVPDWTKKKCDISKTAGIIAKSSKFRPSNASFVCSTRNNHWFCSACQLGTRVRKFNLTNNRYCCANYEVLIFYSEGLKWITPLRIQSPIFIIGWPGLVRGTLKALEMNLGGDCKLWHSKPRDNAFSVPSCPKNERINTIVYRAWFLLLVSVFFRSANFVSWWKIDFFLKNSVT